MVTFIFRDFFFMLCIFYENKLISGCLKSLNTISFKKVFFLSKDTKKSFKKTCFWNENLKKNDRHLFRV